MKKRIALVFMMSLLSVGAFCVIAHTVDREKDAVTIRENALYGDSSYAADAKILTKATYQNHLFWNTDYTIGTEPECRTDYTFSYFKEKTSMPSTPAGIEMNSSLEHGFDLHTPEEKLTPLTRLYNELYLETPADGTRKKTIYLQDYYDYYPLQLDIDLPGVMWKCYPQDLDAVTDADAYAVYQTFCDFFKIPLPKDTGPFEISITRSTQGTSGVSIDSVESGIYNHYWFNTVSAYTDDQCFFSINNVIEKSEEETCLIDDSQIPGGYGIYSFRYENVRNDTNTKGEMTIYQDGWKTGIDKDSLAMVYALPVEETVLRMFVSTDQTKLFLLTDKNGICWLTEIEIATMQEMRKTSLGASLYYSCGQADDYFLLSSTERLALFAKDADGTYTLTFDVPAPYAVNEKFAYVRVSVAMDYDGEKLILADRLYEEQYRALDTCGFYTAVYTADGLAYYGEYKNSLSLLSDPYAYPKNALPLQFSVEWGNEQP